MSSFHSLTQWKENESDCGLQIKSSLRIVWISEGCLSALPLPLPLLLVLVLVLAKERFLAPGFREKKEKPWV